MSSNCSRTWAYSNASCVLSMTSSDCCGVCESRELEPSRVAIINEGILP